MVIDQLKQDSQKLGHHIYNLNKRGRTRKAYKVAKRNMHLFDSIAELKGG